ncbi:MAG: nitric oxide synthase oxygenase, partial [Myxococcales bacterium]|nr:nitric oxide synthase oxygenase [Myxococcales bacterium]
RNLDIDTQRIARESYRALHPDPDRRFQTFEEYASAFIAMGFTAHEWQLSKQALLWALESHGPYLEEAERADLRLGEAGVLGRFYQIHVIDRARACEPAILLSDAEVAELGAYWAQCKGARTKFGEVFYRSIFKRHPEVVQFFQQTDMDRLSLHLFDAADLAIGAAPNFWAGRPVFRRLGQVHAARGIPASAYPAVNEHVVDTLDHFIPLGAGVRRSLQKAMFIVSLLTMQQAVQAERVEREAERWIRQIAEELRWPDERVQERLATIRASIRLTGTYDHSSEELSYGAQVAWRNSAKCIGRISWNLLRVRDCRHVTSAAGMLHECEEHLRIATAQANMEAVMTVFAPRRPRERWGPRFWNQQLVRYAGYLESDGSVTGDPANLHLTERIMALGWTPPEPRTPFDVLPVVLELPEQPPHLYGFPEASVLRVAISHPSKREFSDLHLEWCAVPTITAFNLRLGGVDYVCCPFNGWFMQSEIARNLWERYKVGSAVAGLFGFDTGDPMWEDRAWNELNEAVLHSFREARLSMVDHRSACKQFFTHVERERKQGREVPAQWSWVVPAIGGSTVSLWHHEMRDFELFPQYRYCAERFLFGQPAQAEAEDELAVHIAELGAAGALEPLDILILYGSETGTCEGYAAMLLRQLRALQPTMLSLDEAVAEGALVGHDVILVVTSTFGEGRPPSNAIVFDRTPLPDLRGTRVAVFAAGSKIYPNYGKFGKQVFARLCDEGHATPLGDVMLGDELAGQGKAFEEFSRIVVNRIAPTLAERGGVGEQAAFEVRVLTDDGDFAWPPAQGDEGCQYLPVLENRELLQRGTDRSTRLIRFDLSASAPALEYTTGDHLKVWPITEPELVAQMCGLLEVSAEALVDVVDVGTGTRARAGFPLPNRVGNILGLYLDLSLRKESLPQLLPVLIANCSDSLVKSTLRRWLHDLKSERADAVGDEIVGKYVSVAALLSAFPACRLSLAQAIELLPKQKPRYYSISSGARSSGASFVEITVSVVRETTSFGVDRLGLCSNYLNSLRPGLDRAWINVRPSHFRAPPDPSYPVLMVGPGTGLAPMMGFLADRGHLLQSDSFEVLGERVLYFGCRNDADFLYGDRLERYHEQGILTHLRVAFSQKQAGQKRYVQHLMAEQQRQVVALLRDPNLYYYVCGDAGMADQVEQTLIMLLVGDGMGRTDAFLHLQRMKDEGRFQTDVWGVTYSSLAQVKQDKHAMAKRWMDSLEPKEAVVEEIDEGQELVELLCSRTGATEQHARRALESAAGDMAKALRALRAFRP